MFAGETNPVFAADARIAIASWSLMPESPEHMLEALRRIEIRAVQLALTPIINNPAHWGQTIALLRDNGIAIVSGMMAMAGEDYSTLQSIARTGGVTPDETWLANRQQAAAVARLAADHGILLISFHAGFIPEAKSDPGRPMFLDRLGQIADIFGQHEIDIALETGQETAQTLCDALEDLHRPNLGVNFDPANMILYGMGDPTAAFDFLCDNVRQVHVKDAVKTRTPGTWGREVVAGSGDVDWKSFFQIALDLDPPVNFVIEREANSGRDADLLAARDLIRQHVRA